MAQSVSAQCMYITHYNSFYTGTGLQQSRALVAVITNKYINSKFCTNELYTASSDQKHIFPIILENIDFNSSERARGVKYVIRAINWTMFRHGYDDYQMSVDRLVKGMRECGLGNVPDYAMILCL